MDKIEKVRSISIWVFIIPFVALNLCLILITQFHELFPNKSHIIHNTIPYIDGGTSISRTARVFPTYLIFITPMSPTSSLECLHSLYSSGIDTESNGNLSINMPKMILKKENLHHLMIIKSINKLKHNRYKVRAVTVVDGIVEISGDALIAVL